MFLESTDLCKVSDKLQEKLNYYKSTKFLIQHIYEDPNFHSCIHT